MIKSIIDGVKNKVRTKKKEKGVALIKKSPHDRLELMRAAYKKFSPSLTERERAKMKKEIKTLERAVSNWDRAVAKQLKRQQQLEQDAA